MSWVAEQETVVSGSPAELLPATISLQRPCFTLSILNATEQRLCTNRWYFWFFSFPRIQRSFYLFPSEMETISISGITHPSKCWNLENFGQVRDVDKQRECVATSIGGRPRAAAGWASLFRQISFSQKWGIEIIVYFILFWETWSQSVLLYLSNRSREEKKTTAIKISSFSPSWLPTLLIFLAFLFLPGMECWCPRKWCGECKEV